MTFDPKTVDLNHPTMRALNHRRRAFVLAFAACGHAGAAAEAAGYSPKSAPVTGARLLKKYEVAQALKYVGEIASKDTPDAIMSVEESQKLLSDIARGDIGEPVFNLAGEVVGESAPKIRDRIAAAEKLRKMRGEWKERIEVTHRQEFGGTLLELEAALEEKLAAVRAEIDRQGLRPAMIEAEIVREGEE